MTDIEYGIRQLRRDRTFALTAVLTIAIGIGANTAVFTLANALLFRDPAGVAEPGRLVDIGVSVKGAGFGSGSYPDYIDISRRSTLLSGVYARPRFPQSMNLRTASVGGPGESVYATAVSLNYFQVLGAAPFAGRLFNPDDSTSEAASVVVLAHRFWVRHFNGDFAAIGSTLWLDGRPFTIVGVASDGFQGTGIRGGDVWIPLRADSRRATAWLVMGARLKPGVSVAQAASELDQIGRLLRLEHPAENSEKSFRAAKLSPVPGETAPLLAFLALLLAIVMTVLAIACANISNLLLLRASARRREIAVRVAVGAARSRIVTQLLTETVLLFLVGAAAGLWAARVMTSAIVSPLSALPFPVQLSLALDWRAALFSTGLSFVAAVLCGLAPALQASKSDLLTGLKHGAPTASRRLWIRHAFVVTQIALSILLVIVGGLFVRSVIEVVSSDPGFDPKNVEVVSVSVSTAGNNRTATPALAREWVARLRKLPNVEAATVAAVVPGGFEGIGLGALSAESAAVAGAAPPVSPVWNTVEPGYFETLRMPLLAGRDFNADDREGSQPVIILGQAAARKFWPGENPIGRYVQQTSWTRSGMLRRTLQVIGVARDPKFGSLVDGTTGFYAYVPLQQQYLPWQTLIVVRAARPMRLIGDIREIVSSENPNVTILSAQTAEQYAALGLMPQRIAAASASSLGAFGMLLAGIGVYGVASGVVRRRTREIGIRVALGARGIDIVTLVLKQGLYLVAAGTVIGLVLAIGAAQVLSAFLVGIQALDPATFGAATAVFGLITLAASYIPARRATRIHPIQVLRDE